MLAVLLGSAGLGVIRADPPPSPGPAPGAPETRPGWTRYARPLPEAVVALDEPFLEVIAEANREGWVKDEDRPLVEESWTKTIEHAQRLGHDRLYRLGCVARRELSQNQMLAGARYESLWSPPFLICASDGGERLSESDLLRADRPSRPLREVAAGSHRFDALLAEAARLAQDLYRGLLADYGKDLGVAPLEYEWGGRPDFPPTVRSFPDGFPLRVWVWSSERVFREAVHASPISVPYGVRNFLEAGDTDLQVMAVEDKVGVAASARLDLEATASGLMGAVLMAFRRQADRWSIRPEELGALVTGWCWMRAGWTREADELHYTGEPHEALDVLADLFRDYRAAGGRPKWLGLSDLVRITRPDEAAKWMARHGQDPRWGWPLWRAQAWALVRFLTTSDDPRRRAAVGSALKAYVQREPAGPVLRMALGLHDDEELSAIEKEYVAWLEARAAEAAAQRAK